MVKKINKNRANPTGVKAFVASVKKNVKQSRRRRGPQFTKWVKKPYQHLTAEDILRFPQKGRDYGMSPFMEHLTWRRKAKMHVRFDRMRERDAKEKKQARKREDELKENTEVVKVEEPEQKTEKSADDKNEEIVFSESDKVFIARLDFLGKWDWLRRRFLRQPKRVIKNIRHIKSREADQNQASKKAKWKIKRWYEHLNRVTTKRKVPRSFKSALSRHYRRRYRPLMKAFLRELRLRDHGRRPIQARVGRLARYFTAWGQVAKWREPRWRRIRYKRQRKLWEYEGRAGRLFGVRYASHFFWKKTFAVLSRFKWLSKYTIGGWANLVTLPRPIRQPPSRRLLKLWSHGRALVMLQKEQIKKRSVGLHFYQKRWLNLAKLKVQKHIKAVGRTLINNHHGRMRRAHHLSKGRLTKSKHRRIKYRRKCRVSKA